MEKQGGYLPQSSENGPVTWDTEEDHLLSYFLGGEAQSQGGNSHNLTVTPQQRQQQRQRQRIAPSTPAVQFYSSTKGSYPPPAAPVQSASSSCSSLSSMAATLVNGGPVLHHQYHHHAAAHHQALSSRSKSSSRGNTPPSTNISPISPAATMGTPQEMLMLPPPPRESGGDKSEAERQQHLAWLQQINNMAMMNRGQQPLPPQPGQQPPPQQPPQQQHLMQPPPHYGGVLAPNPMFHNPAALQQTPAVESEERRARRLARNRESARQSRRRKKDNLARLSKQVNGLHDAIEEERRQQLNRMEEKLQKLRFEAIQQLANSVSGDSAEEAPSLDDIRELLDNLGPNCAVRQNCVSFQYSALKQLMLPKYQAFILWLTLQDESFFSAGKEQKAKNSRVSSKQVGEELTNEWKKAMAAGEPVSPDQPDSDCLQARVDEAARLWPLFCYEMSISVDQEDKLMAFRKKAQELAAKDRSEMSDATKMVMNMKKGILNHCQSTVGRSEQVFSGTLNPTQSAAFFKWYTENSELLRTKQLVPNSIASTTTKEDKGDTSIRDLCQRLTQVLTLPESAA